MYQKWTVKEGTMSTIYEHTYYMSRSKGRSGLVLQLARSGDRASLDGAEQRGDGMVYSFRGVVFFSSTFNELSINYKWLNTKYSVLV